jgi:hypothetical protein
LGPLAKPMRMPGAKVLEKELSRSTTPWVSRASRVGEQ